MQHYAWEDLSREFTDIPHLFDNVLAKDLREFHLKNETTQQYVIYLWNATGCQGTKQTNLTFIFYALWNFPRQTH